MSSFIFYKVTYEGSLQKIQELFKQRDWNIDMKIPEENILLLKFPKDEIDEINYYNDVVIDEETQTKFKNFEIIKESDFEKGNTLDLNNINNDKYNKKEKTISSGLKKTKTKEYKKQISEILLGDTIPEINKKNENCWINEIFYPIINICNINEFHDKINKEYKDPTDYFFSQNYLIMIFILAVICLIVFNF